MKRSLLIVLFVVFSLIAIAHDFSATAPSGQVLYYNIYSGNAVVAHPGSYGWSGYTKPTGSLTIPSSVTYGGQTYSVTAIGDSAFYDCNGLTGTLTIPNSIITIGNDAFFYCSGVTSLTIPNSVTTIGARAFQGCSGLTSLTVPNSVTTIENGAFYGCSCLTSLFIPNTVTTIGVTAFYGCSGLTSLTIPNSVTTIGDYSFHNCSGLTSLTIPSSVTTIGNSAFGDCTSLTVLNYCADSIACISAVGINSSNHPFSGCTNIDTVIIGNSVRLVPANFLSGHTQLGSLSIGNSVNTIGADAFRDCCGLSGALTIPNSVTLIGEQAFSGCNSLTSLTIPTSVTSIGARAFNGCSDLTVLNYYADSIASISTGGIFSINHPFRGCANINTVIIGDSVRMIPANFLSDHTQLCSLTIGNSVSTIGAGAFHGCSGLSGVLTIPNSVTTIGESAFYGCSGLTSITISNIVTTISSRTFSDCCGVTSLTIPISVKTIGSHAFYNCSNLTSLTIPDSVTTIGNMAFSNCSGLINLTIGNAVVIIGNGSFSNCCGLEVLDMGNSVSEIGDSAFFNCSGIASITIPQSVTFIGNLAFSQCSELETVYFNAMNCSNAGGSASKRAFYNCNNISTINIGDSVTTIPSFLGYGCSGMSSVAIPNAVTSIGSSAFQGCIGLTSINIPNSTNKIGVSAFQGCDHITNITLGTGVDTIKDGAFRGCTQVVRMTSKSMTPPTVYVNTFNGLSDDVILDVPCDAANAYENAAYWFRFNIQEDLVYDFSATSSDPARGTVAIVTEPTCDYREAQVQANAYHGYHFDHWSDGNTDNPRYIVVLQDTHFVAFFASDNREDEDVEEVVENRVKCYQQSGQIVVEGTEGNNVMVYDLYGRVLATKRNEGSLLRFDVPATGTYLIRVGDSPARTVVVVR